MTNTKGMTMPQIDDAELFGNAEDQRAYEDFCANQEAVEKFTLDKPALVCRWRMSNKRCPCSTATSAHCPSAGAGRAAYP